MNAQFGEDGRGLFNEVFARSNVQLLPTDEREDALRRLQDERFVTNERQELLGA